MSTTSILPDDDPVSIPSQRTMPGRKTPRGERLRAGDVLLGRYTVLSELGEGGMGVVYKCLDSVGGIEVALKCLPPELSRDEAEMEGIRENYALVANLHHSAISGLRQLEKDPDSGEYYVVMDLAEGEDLSQILRRRRGTPMTLEEALAILRPLAAALDCAHAEKVLHRDVKPANVKVRPPAVPGDPPRVQLLDFGLAAEVRSSLSRISRRGHMGSSGTPAYMAPEQWEARPQGPAADQYALAVMAYEMLAGARPFGADDPDVLRRAVLSRVPDPIPGLPRGANAALRRALAKDSVARFPSCKAFVEALQTGRGGSKNRLRGLGLAVAVLVAVVAGVLCFTPSRGGSGGGGASSPSETSAPAPVEYGPENEPVAEPSGGAAFPSEPSSPVESDSENEPDAEPSGGASFPSEPSTPSSPLSSPSSPVPLSPPDDTATEDLLSDARALADLARLKASAARDVGSVRKFRRWNDGEFKTRFATLDENKKDLDGLSASSDLPKAKSAADAVHSAAVWIAENAAAKAKEALVDAEAAKIRED